MHATEKPSDLPFDAGAYAPTKPEPAASLGFFVGMLTAGVLVVLSLLGRIDEFGWLLLPMLLGIAAYHLGNLLGWGGLAPGPTAGEEPAAILAQCLEQCTPSAIEDVMARFAAATPEARRSMAAASRAFRSSAYGRLLLECGGDYEEGLLAIIRGLAGTPAAGAAATDREPTGRATVAAAEPFGSGSLVTLQVVQGAIRRGDPARVVRGERVVADGLRLAADEFRAAETGEALDTVEKGDDCATVVQGYGDVRRGDVVEAGDFAG